MSGYVGKATNLLHEVTAEQDQSEREDVWGEIPGKIVEYDAAKQTAKIQPLYKPKHNGKAIDMPELLDVPVRFPRSGGGGLTHPVKPDDRVTLRAMMRSNEKYHLEDDGEASDVRSMNLSDMEAHVAGGESLTDPIQNFDADNTHLRADAGGQYGLRQHESGKYSMIGAEGNVLALIRQGLDLARETASTLATEPALIHTATYSTIASQLQDIVSKLESMEI